MKHKLILAAFALLGLLTFTLTSCKEDKGDDTNIVFSNMELGMENSHVGNIGDDLHIEFNVVSNVKIKSIAVALTQQGQEGYSHVWTDKKYTNVLNTTFHQHIDLDEDAFTAGKCHVTITVTDINGAFKTIESDIVLKGIDPNAPQVEVTYPDAQHNTAVAGQKLLIQATITVKSPIKGIEVEFHGDKGEYPVDIDAYNGQDGTVKFNQEVTVPAACPAGEYHIHLTVTDSHGLKRTGEFEGLQISAAK